MIRRNPAVRAIGLACAISIACVAAASADEPPKPAEPVVVPETKPAPAPAPAAAPAAKPPEDWVRTGLYFGPAFGVADVDGGTEFAWALQVLYRPFRYGGLQLEYQNLGPENQGSGDFDGLYLGVAPMLPLAEPITAFLQAGGMITSDEGDAFAGGAGMLFDLTLPSVEKYLPGGLTLRADYKYIDFEDSAHVLMAGIMYRFGFVKKK